MEEREKKKKHENQQQKQQSEPIFTSSIAALPWNYFILILLRDDLEISRIYAISKENS